MTTAHAPRAFLLSAVLHGLVIAIAVYFSYAAGAQVKKLPRILELVAGEGTAFGATEAPALGVPGGVKIALSKPPISAAETAAPIAEPLPQPAVATPRPATKATPTPNSKPERTIAQNLRHNLIVADVRARKQVAKEREAEKKALTKEEFDKAQRTKIASAKTPAPKIEKIDAEGIAKGVIGGSTANKTGGAGGTALTVAERSASESYAAGLNKLLTDELYKIPGLEDGLRAEAEFEVLASGRLARGRIVRSSHNERFDLAVLHAIAAVRMPMGPPAGFDRVQQVAFSSHEKE